MAAAMMLWPLAAGASSKAGHAAMDAALAENAQVVKRLFLTDGSYQTATEWKKDGDRVRYFSAERGEAEEFLRSRAEKFSGEWWKLIPLEDLTPGEYAIVIPAPRNENNAVVWDFGVDK